MAGKAREQDAFYRIGAVAQHTGLPANTIRTWERRYGAVHPRRSPRGGRLYTDDDIVRLQLLKALVQRQDAISAIAALSNEALSSRLARSESPTSTSETRRQRDRLAVALLHRSLGAAVARHGPEFGTWDVVVEDTEVDSFSQAAGAQPPIDVAILELALLGDEPEAAFERCVEATGAEVAVVIHHFASRRLLEALGDAGARLVRAPVQLGTLKRRVLDQLSSRGSRLAPLMDKRTEIAEPVPPLYDEEQLFRLRSLATTVDCECPHHLAQIIETLVAFEHYSASCESRNLEDEAVHRLLRRGTGLARMQMEELLTRVLEHEDIVL